MPARRRRPRARREDAPRPLVTGIVTGAPSGWQARAVSAERARKPYVCPDCNQAIRPGTPHVVAWRVDEEDQRRHWHRPCWERARGSGRL